MAKLETQINQIYLVHPEAKKTSIILYEEKLKGSLHLFVLLELTNIKKKTESAELKKISDVILECFRANQKMPINSLFEATLAQINQKLGDVAHKGSKTWLGKFSALIALKSDTEIFISNSGQTAAWLKRKSEFTEIIGPEKKGEHPLKIFLNFASGRIKEQDSVIITTNSLFNFVSLQLLTNLLSDNSLAETCDQVSQILQDSAGPEDTFAAFFLQFQKGSETIAVKQTNYQDAYIEEVSAVSPVVIPSEPQEPIYAPLPEDLKTPMEMPKLKIPNISGLKDSAKNLVNVRSFKFKLPSIKLFNWRRFNNLSNSGKFFLICFVIFLIVLILNLTVIGSRSAAKRNQEKLSVKADEIVHQMTEAESALLYKNDDQAIRLLNETKVAIEEVRNSDEKKGNELNAKWELLSDKINRITNITNPKVVTEIKHNPIFLARAGNGFFMANKDSNSLSLFATEYKSLFILNSVNGEISGINHLPNSGNWVTANNQFYKVNSDLTEFDLMTTVANAKLQGIKFNATSNRVYSANLSTNQIMRWTLSGGRLTAPTSLLKTGVNMQNLQDFGVDTDVYLLFPSEVKKFVNGNEQAFRLQRLSDPITNATRIVVGNNLYVLEPSKKRLVITTKQGVLSGQIVFPNAGLLTDFYVNENDRRITLIDGNKLIEITF